MEVSRNGSAVVPQKTTKGKKAIRQVGNATLTAAAVGATAVGTLELCKKNYFAGLVNSNSCKTLKPITGNFISRKFRYACSNFASKFYNAMSNVGNKLFPKTGRWNYFFEGLVKNREGKISKSMLNAYKGNAALLILGGIVSIAVITAGAFKAGKIYGENK
jgi:hypothetical protein